MKSHATFMTLTLEGLVVLCLLQRVHNIGDTFIVHASEVEIWNSEIENWDVGCNADLYVVNQESTNLIREVHMGEAPFVLHALVAFNMLILATLRDPKHYKGLRPTLLNLKTSPSSRV